jgi:hypothetical protein
MVIGEARDGENRDRSNYDEINLSRFFRTVRSRHVAGNAPGAQNQPPDQKSVRFNRL